MLPAVTWAGWVAQRPQWGRNMADAGNPADVSATAETDPDVGAWGQRTGQVDDDAAALAQAAAVGVTGRPAGVEADSGGGGAASACDIRGEDGKSGEDATGAGASGGRGDGGGSNSPVVVGGASIGVSASGHQLMRPVSVPHRL